jgi:DNA-binding winged helix-turn-helix (wHTH) protein/tetratricopeptide (TPR) repeat protein
MTGLIYRFGPFDLDTGNHELRRDGAVVKLAPQPFKILAALVAQGGGLVSRDELREAVWGADHFVDFNSGLNFCIAQVRAALGDDASSPLYVGTVPRLGYRFVAPVQGVPAPEAMPAAPPAEARPRRRWSWAAPTASAAVLATVATFTLRAAPRPGPVHSPPVTARTEYERGALGLDDAGPDELRTRVRRFEAALQADPSYAQAYAALAQAKLLMADYRAEAPQAAYAHAKAAAARALELDPALPEAHAAYAAAVLSFGWDWAEAESHFSEAMRRGAGDARVLHWYSRYLAARGRTGEALEAATRAAGLDPRSARAQANLGLIAFYAGRHAEAIAACEHAVALLPQFTPGRQCAMSAAAHAGDLATAVRHASALMEESGSDADTVQRFQRTVAREGLPGFWRWRLRLARGDGSAAACDARALSLALLSAQVGDREAALTWLERAAELHVDSLVYARVHPALAALQGLPRYSRVLERVGLPRT